jgi:hypothetical protein
VIRLPYIYAKQVIPCSYKWAGNNAQPVSQGIRGVAFFTLMWAQRKKKSQRIRVLVFFRMFINQLCSINRAISPRQSEQAPTSNKSPALTTPEKLVIVTA